MAIYTTEVVITWAIAAIALAVTIWSLASVLRKKEDWFDLYSFLAPGLVVSVCIALALTHQTSYDWFSWLTINHAWLPLLTISIVSIVLCVIFGSLQATWKDERQLVKEIIGSVIMAATLVIFLDSLIINISHGIIWIVRHWP